MNFRDEAHAIVEKVNSEKWHETREKIEAKLGEAYRLGFLDGEASAKPEPEPCELEGQPHSCA